MANTPLSHTRNNFALILAALVPRHTTDLAMVAHEAYHALQPGRYFLVTDFHRVVIVAGWRTELP